MFDALTVSGLNSSFELLDLLIHFILGSMILITSAWILERRIKSPRLGIVIWKTALFGSLLFFIPYLPLTQNEVNIPSISITAQDIFVRQPVQLVTAGVEISPLPAGQAAEKIIVDYSDNDWPVWVREARPGTLAKIILLSLAIVLSLLLASVGARFYRAHMRALRCLRRSTKLEAMHPASQMLEAICQAAGVRERPALFVSQLVDSPLVTFGSKIYLPVWILDQMDDRQLQAILSHEIAHVRYRDPNWIIAARLIQKFFFVQPLFRYAVKRLEYFTELRADEWAADQLQDGKLLAETLYQCALHQQFRRGISERLGTPAEAFGLYMHTPAARESESGLFLRIRRLLRLDQSQAISKNKILWFGASMVMALLAIVASLPLLYWQQVSTKTCEAEQDFPPTAECYAETSRFRYIGAVIDGPVILNSGYDGFASLSPNGSAVFIDRGTFTATRRLVIRQTDNGLTYEYQVNKDQREMDAEGKAWLKQALFATLLGDGHSAPVRVPQLLTMGGPARVLEEMTLLRTSYAIDNYAAVLRDRISLTAREEAQITALLMHRRP